MSLIRARTGLRQAILWLSPVISSKLLIASWVSMCMNNECLSDGIMKVRKWTKCVSNSGLIRTYSSLQSSHTLVLASKFQQAYNGLISMFMRTRFMSKVCLDDGLKLDHMCKHLRVISRPLELPMSSILVLASKFQQACKLGFVILHTHV